MRITIEMKSTAPLMMHNSRLSDPDNEFVIAIKELTSKGVNQTDIDRAQIRKLEWFGGIYDDEGKVIMPTANITKSLRNAGAQTKVGKKIASSLLPLTLNVPLIYDGPQGDLEKLYQDNRFVDSRQVKIGRALVKRTRPFFAKWSLQAEYELIETELDLSQISLFAERAGMIFGIGDARILGFGRYEANVYQHKMAKAA